MILATPVLEGLHSAYPSAEIDLMVKKGMEGLFRGHPFTGRLIVWDKKHKYRDAWRILKELRKNSYDLLINVQRFGLTGLLSVLSGAKTTIGFSKNPFSVLFTKRVPHLIGQGIHEVERNLSLIKPLIPANQRARDFAKPPRPMLYPTAEDELKIKTYQTEAYVTLSPASLWFTKQYPAEKWAELIRSIPSGMTVYLLGSSTDIEVCSEIKTLAGRDSIHILAGKLSFLESAAMMRDAEMNYTNDSAPMHLASAVNAKTTAVYCSTVPEFGFGPLSDTHFIVQTEKHLACRPCGLHGRRGCPEKHFECGFSIRPGQFPGLT